MGLDDALLGDDFDEQSQALAVIQNWQANWESLLGQLEPVSRLAPEHRLAFLALSLQELIPLLARYWSETSLMVRPFAWTADRAANLPVVAARSTFTEMRSEQPTTSGVPVNRVLDFSAADESLPPEVFNLIQKIRYRAAHYYDAVRQFLFTLEGKTQDQPLSGAGAVLETKLLKHYQSFQGGNLRKRSTAARSEQISSLRNQAPEDGNVTNESIDRLADASAADDPDLISNDALYQFRKRCDNVIKKAVKQAKKYTKGAEIPTAQAIEALHTAATMPRQNIETVTPIIARASELPLMSLLQEECFEDKLSRAQSEEWLSLGDSDSQNPEWFEGLPLVSQQYFLGLIDEILLLPERQHYQAVCRAVGHLPATYRRALGLTNHWLSQATVQKERLNLMDQEVTQWLQLHDDNMPKPEGFDALDTEVKNWLQFSARQVLDYANNIRAGERHTAGDALELLNKLTKQTTYADQVKASLEEKLRVILGGEKLDLTSDEVTQWLQLSHDDTADPPGFDQLEEAIKTRLHEAVEQVREETDLLIRSRTRVSESGAHSTPTNQGVRSKWLDDVKAALEQQLKTMPRTLEELVTEFLPGTSFTEDKQLRLLAQFTKVRQQCLETETVLALEHVRVAYPGPEISRYSRDERLRLIEQNLEQLLLVHLDGVLAKRVALWGFECLQEVNQSMTLPFLFHTVLSPNNHDVFNFTGVQNNREMILHLREAMASLQEKYGQAEGFLYGSEKFGAVKLRLICFHDNVAINEQRYHKQLVRDCASFTESQDLVLRSLGYYFESVARAVPAELAEKLRAVATILCDENMTVGLLSLSRQGLDIDGLRAAIRACQNHQVPGGYRRAVQLHYQVDLLEAWVSLLQEVDLYSEAAKQLEIETRVNVSLRAASFERQLIASIGLLGDSCMSNHDRNNLVSSDMASTVAQFAQHLERLRADPDAEAGNAFLTLGDIRPFYWSPQVAITENGHVERSRAHEIPGSHGLNRVAMSVHLGYLDLSERFKDSAEEAQLRQESAETGAAHLTTGTKAQVASCWQVFTDGGLWGSCYAGLASLKLWLAVQPFTREYGVGLRARPWLFAWGNSLEPSRTLLRSTLRTALGFPGLDPLSRFAQPFYAGGAQQLLSEVLGLSEQPTEPSAWLLANLGTAQVKSAMLALMRAPTVRAADNGLTVAKLDALVRGIESLDFRVSPANSLAAHTLSAGQMQLMMSYSPDERGFSNATSFLAQKTLPELLTRVFDSFAVALQGNNDAGIHYFIEQGAVADVEKGCCTKTSADNETRLKKQLGVVGQHTLFSLLRDIDDCVMGVKWPQLSDREKVFFLELWVCAYQLDPKEPARKARSLARHFLFERLSVAPGKSKVPFTQFDEKCESFVPASALLSTKTSLGKLFLGPWILLGTAFFTQLLVAALLAITRTGPRQRGNKALLTTRLVYLSLCLFSSTTSAVISFKYRSYLSLEHKRLPLFDRKQAAGKAFWFAVVPSLATLLAVGIAATAIYRFPQLVEGDKEFQQTSSNPLSYAALGSFFSFLLTSPLAYLLNKRTLNLAEQAPESTAPLAVSP